MIYQPRRRTVLNEFRESRGQSYAPPKKETPPPRKSQDYSPYASFKRRFNDFEECVDDFGTRDLVYYFREVAEENGYHYTIANIKKDMAIMKRLRENYSNREICAMVEFLYTSEQDYLQKDRLSPNLLASQWVNTIYADTQLWVDDQYVPQSIQKTSKRKKSQHEWDSDGSDSAKIGVKL